MSKIIDVLWIEDDTELVDGYLENFEEDKDHLGFIICPFHYTSKKKFDEESDYELSSLVMGLVIIDYNLPGGVNGDEIIREIRSHEANKNINIIFYSTGKNESELEEILKDSVEDLSNIFFAQKDTLEDRIINLLSE